jgi:DNA repair photolyase
MKRFTGHGGEEWGSYVDVKINSVELFKKEIFKFKKKHTPVEQKSFCIHFGSVTDVYQPLEAKYKITRECLKILKDNDIKSEISILTKSRLVLRDIDLLKELSGVSVGLTLTSTSDELSRVIEPNSSVVSERLNVLKKLNQAGIKTYAFVGPLIPGILDTEKELWKLFSLIAETGNKEIWVELLNPRGGKVDKIYSSVRNFDKELGKEIRQKCELLNTAEYRKRIQLLLDDYAKELNLFLTVPVIEH